MDGFHHIIANDGMITRGVGSDGQDNFGLENIADRVCHGPASQCGGKTCHR
jgi:hypothetical protein